jgi:hypothetical protein
MRKSFFEWSEFEPHGNCYVGVAIVGAGALGAGASIYGADKAASAQTNAANEAIAEQQQQFQVAQQQLQPFINAGSANLPQQQAFLDTSNPNSPLSQLLALTTPGTTTDSNGQPTSTETAALAQTPGYQFSLTQGLKATQDALAARGLGGPGGALAKGDTQYAEGLAGTTWQNVVNALQNSFTSGSGALQNLTNTGASSAQALASGAIQTGQGVGSNLVGIGNAQAGAAGTTANAVGSLGNSVSTAALLQSLTGGSGSGLYGNQAQINAGLAPGVSNGGFNFLDAAAGGVP